MENDSTTAWEEMLLSSLMVVSLLKFTFMHIHELNKSLKTWKKYFYTVRVDEKFCK